MYKKITTAQLNGSKKSLSLYYPNSQSSNCPSPVLFLVERNDCTDFFQGIDASILEDGLTLYGLQEIQLANTDQEHEL